MRFSPQKGYVVDERVARAKQAQPFCKTSVEKAFIILLPVKPLLVLFHEALVLLGLFQLLLLPQGQLRHILAIHLSQ